MQAACICCCESKFTRAALSHDRLVESGESACVVIGVFLISRLNSQHRAAGFNVTPLLEKALDFLRLCAVGGRVCTAGCGPPGAYQELTFTQQSSYM